MIYLDAGTTYSKIITTNNENFDEKYFVQAVQNKNYYIVPSNIIKSIEIHPAGCCGHMSNANENEIVALAKGFLAMNLDDPNATILDLGSRDAKWIRFQDKKFHDMDWNTSCASSTGATVEMLLKFYNVNRDELEFNEEKFAVTCGIFGLEKIMDDISGGAEPKTAIAKFIHGIAYNAWVFAKKPEKLYISGGFCDNKCFVESLTKYCEIIPLGRFVLCEGLINEQ